MVNVRYIDSYVSHNCLPCLYLFGRLQTHTFLTAPQTTKNISLLPNPCFPSYTCIAPLLLQLRTLKGQILLMYIPQPLTFQPVNLFYLKPFCFSLCFLLTTPRVRQNLHNISFNFFEVIILTKRLLKFVLLRSSNLFYKLSDELFLDKKGNSCYSQNKLWVVNIHSILTSGFTSKTLLLINWFVLGIKPN